MVAVISGSEIAAFVIYFITERRRVAPREESSLVWQKSDRGRFFIKNAP